MAASRNEGIFMDESLTRIFAHKNPVRRANWLPLLSEGT